MRLMCLRFLSAGDFRGDFRPGNPFSGPELKRRLLGEGQLVTKGRVCTRQEQHHVATLFTVAQFSSDSRGHYSYAASDSEDYSL